MGVGYNLELGLAICISFFGVGVEGRSIHWVYCIAAILVMDHFSHCIYQELHEHLGK